MSRFFIDETPTLGEYLLEGPEAHHISQVMRLQVGEVITLFCGDGIEHSAKILEVTKKAVRCEILESVQVNRERGYHLHLAVALPRGDRADFLIEKLVELGVAEFTPLSTERSVVKTETWKAEKFRRAVIEACKQCRRNVLMKVNMPTRWNEFLKQPFSAPKFIAHVPETFDTPSIEWIGNAVYAVGPEGGFAPQEVEAALQNGWQTLSLGASILRVETAAMAIAARCGL